MIYRVVTRLGAAHHVIAAGFQCSGSLVIFWTRISGEETQTNRSFAIFSEPDAVTEIGQEAVK